MDRYEYINWWGYSPPLDLLEDLQTDTDEVNILSFGAGDCRHILETLSNLFKRKKKVNFYVVESSMELYARHMLLMSIILKQQTVKGIREKSEVFLEIHGNALIRKQTVDCIQENSELLLKMVTDYGYLEEKLPLFDLTNLKYKERDCLEGIFKYWRKPEIGDKFDLAKCWDFRLRSYLGSRYDAIPNVFDWHFYMRLVDKHAEIIGSRNYIRWRRTGVSYRLREADYIMTNKTLASAVILKKEGDRIPTRGFWGDIILGPYVSFGIECQEESFFKRCNKMLTKTSEDVAMYNMERNIYQIIYGEEHKPTTSSCNFISNEFEGHNQEGEGSSRTSAEADVMSDGEFIHLGGVKIIFLSHLIPPKLHHHSEFKKKFQVIYFGNSQLQILTKDLCDTFQDTAVLYFETAKFMLDLKKEEIERFDEKIREIAESVGCKGPTDLSNGAHVRFSLERQSGSQTR